MKWIQTTRGYTYVDDNGQPAPLPDYAKTGVIQDNSDNAPVGQLVDVSDPYAPGYSNGTGWSDTNRGGFWASGKWVPYAIGALSGAAALAGGGAAGAGAGVAGADAGATGATTAGLDAGLGAAATGAGATMYTGVPLFTAGTVAGAGSGLSTGLVLAGAGAAAGTGAALANNSSNTNKTKAAATGAATGMTTKDWLTLGLNGADGITNSILQNKQANANTALSEAQLAQQQKQFDASLANQQAMQAGVMSQADPLAQQRSRQKNALLGSLLSHYTPSKYDASNQSFSGGASDLTSTLQDPAVAALFSQAAAQAAENQFTGNAQTASNGQYQGPNMNAVYGGTPMPTPLDLTKKRLFSTLVP